MANVKRIYVEKKAPYAVQARELKQELKEYLDMKELEDVRVLIRYDVEALSEATYEKALVTVFSEPPVDTVYGGHLTQITETGFFLWSIFPASLTSVRIRQSSV